MTSSHTSSHLSLLTYNLNSPSHPRDALRHAHVVDMLGTYRSDIILLQGVTQSVLKLLREATWVKSNDYSLTDIGGNSFRERERGEVIMIRGRRFGQARVVELRSREGQKAAIVATVVVNGRTIALASIDLEQDQYEKSNGGNSNGNGNGGNSDNAIESESEREEIRRVRREQLGVVFGVMRGMKCHDIVLGGSVGSDERFASIMRNDLAEACTYEEGKGGRVGEDKGKGRRVVWYW